MRASVILRLYYIFRFLEVSKKRNREISEI
jgi:hypothetical protein